ncbi:MAG: mycofactocin system GMC family oxidoreductase MftG [SAR202 cluster bacterium]|nr:mycofactocin system GMC family oxidoreductase MftG [Chloroflexota bacterium]MQF95452.1 mycofactocin system GMC family oxidoreductase MftG [SAR202 cluster bacterium]HAA95900.1 mycofactocin system GMC family oxidoreductase MftG [Dehalococcoidia bacterium]MBO19884.1 mycofactocin system GMC family oxidoreductase MftG [Chloroflexota bacterium]MQG33727.1 mycofactocin system GMC family oxidoreductase MftG [SAR202 cluster bacterium]|tara:strand:+ start:4419 stop:5993 length:1575 start_codon:yes stop_codon:yes gene_type:complete
MKYDVVIVGGGAAGSVLAARLAENANTSVLLLEAGTDYPNVDVLPDEVKYATTSYAESPESEHNWALRGTITEEQGEIHVAQGKVIGGGSSINGAAMQRGLPEDFDSWAAMGNDQWSYAKVLPYFRKSEHDMDIRDDFHGTDGPIPVRRRQAGVWPDIQQAFHDACLNEGYPVVEDTNGANPAGVGVWPSNNLDGWRMSAAITHLNPMRHRLNLTVKGNVFARRVLFEGTKAVGVEVESGGEIFTVEAERVVLSAGAIKSPQLLMLSGIGPKDQLEQFGIPVLSELPGVGQNLWNHLSAQVTFKVKDGKSLHGDQEAVHFGLHYTADGSDEVNDMLLRTTPMVDERPERNPGLRTKFLNDDVPTDRVARLSVTLGLPDGAGYVKLASADPTVQPEFNYRYLQHPNDKRRVRDGIRKAADFLESDAYKDVCDRRLHPTDEILADDDALDIYIRQTVGTARHVSGTCKMGPDSDPMAVVDQYCNVKGVQGLSVVDASIKPRITRSGGSHATVLMMAERAVEFVAPA